ncbi:MAG: histidine phosphatase family protein [Spirochaetales bacterium]|uniref:Histidine phosphatase family protein n=1 Tax=Candidatus Thalassospirochaeta sargassi TaxID=3119039 RepID=A0AAJ1MIB1_9SPIO|nr:histidine phosphatase family protein [Spirochaetales bacterium]
MKYLTLVRHAAAVHDAAYRDYERPLRSKGIEKARLNAVRLPERGCCPDMIVSSPAVRAMQTAEIFAAESGCSPGAESILQAEELYLPSPGDILDCVRGLDNRYSDVFLFSHNNGISWAAQQFCNDTAILMPTGAVVRIEFSTDAWESLVFGDGKKIAFLP